MLIEYGVPVIIALLLLLVAWLLPAMMPPSLPFGVRVPPDHEQAPIIAQAQRDYRLGLLASAALLVVVSWLLGLWYSAFAINFGAIFGALLLLSLNYYVVHQRIAQAKVREQWYAGQRQAVIVDTQAYKNVGHLSLPWLLLNAGLLLTLFVAGLVLYPGLPERVLTHFDANGVPNGWSSKLGALLELPVTALLMTLLIVGLTYWLLHMRTQLDPANIEGSRNSRRALNHTWSNALLAISASTNALFLCIALVTWQVLPAGGLMLPLIALAAVLLIAIIIVVAILQTRRDYAQLRANRHESGYVARDDDQYWRAGIFYVNRDDPSIFVPKRFGIGMTVNFGHPVGSLIMALLLGIPLLIAVLTLLLSNQH